MAIECSNIDYNKLQAIGIEERTKQVKEELSDIFLHKMIWDGKVNLILENARQSLDEEQEDILSLEAEIEAELESPGYIAQMDPFVIKHPFLVAQLVLGDDLDNFSQYGYSSRKDLANAVSAYCIGERKVIQKNREVYIWRQREYKNTVTLMDHGDMNVSQVNVEGSGVLMDPPRSGYGLKQDWSSFLIPILRYAQAIGEKDIPEIKNWQELIKELRRNTWGDDFSDFTEEELSLTMLYGRELSGTSDGNLKLWINSSILPHLNGRNLDILRTSETGDVEVPIFGHPQKFQKIANYVPEDIPHLVKANYQLYARSVNDIAKVMYWFNNVVK
jgi:hypothetical protein